MARFSLPTLQELPSVQTALAWLLGEPLSNDKDILNAADLKGVIFSEDGFEKADGAILMCLAQEEIARLPQKPDKVGEILHGIGELVARSHTDALSALFVNCLKQQADQISLSQMLDAAVQCDNSIPHDVDIEKLDIAQWVAHSTLGWSTFDAAVKRLGYGDRVFGHFGLKFAVEAILSTNMSVIDDLIAAQPNHPAIAVIGSVALMLAFQFDSHTGATPLLESRTPAIKCLGAASIVCPPHLQSALNIRDCHSALVKANFDAADATWMTAMHLKKAIHIRYQMEQRRGQNRAQLQRIEQSLDKKTREINNAGLEISRLREQIDRDEESYSILLTELEAMLDSISADWPTNGLSDIQMTWLDQIFVDTTEIRHRLAAKLSHPANRVCLLKRNITQLEDFIGLKKNSADISREYFLPNENQLSTIVPWAAESFILFYENDIPKVAKRTSILVKGVAKAASELIAQPFMPARQPARWQSVITRSTCAMLFTFSVVSAIPAERKNDVAILNSYAIDHVFELLSSGNPPSNANIVLFKLTSKAVVQMGFSTTPDDIREKWALTEILSDFARALALWSSPVLVEKHISLAQTLFRNVCNLPLSFTGYDLQISCMLTLVDTALASCIQAKKQNLVILICELWKSTYQNWVSIDNRWEGIAETLTSAVKAEGVERAQIVADELFANSYCRRLLDFCDKDLNQ